MDAATKPRLTRGQKALFAAVTVVGSLGAGTLALGTFNLIQAERHDRARYEEVLTKETACFNETLKATHRQYTMSRERINLLNRTPLGEINAAVPPDARSLSQDMLIIFVNCKNAAESQVPGAYKINSTL